jgi:hypothetical protein
MALPVRPQTAVICWLAMSSPSLINDPEHWRQRAEEARSV